MYDCVNVVTSNIKTNHKALIACNNSADCRDLNKSRQQVSLRPRSPSQDTACISDLQGGHILSPISSNYIFTERDNLNNSFESFQNILLEMYNKHYPERVVTLTSRDPYYVTPYIKFLLRKKQKLIKALKPEAAQALSLQINKQVTMKTKSILSFDSNVDSKTLWQKINLIRGKTCSTIASNNNITAEAFNTHYSNISFDQLYEPPLLKISCRANPGTLNFVLPYEIFTILDRLKSTASGIDGIPFWFLKLCAPFISEHLAMYFNSFLYLGCYPMSWKCAIIKPIPKICNPIQPSDYRPISLTPILSRIFEKIIVKKCLYPIMTLPFNTSLLCNQYAFKPTGSTTAALVNLLHTTSNLLASYPYIHIISLDFSKAFDTLRHSKVLQNCNLFGLPDEPYNWICDFLRDRKHVTCFNSEVSTPSNINASVIQGSAMGPVCFIINMSNLRPLNSINELLAYADDSYLIVPSVASTSIQAELHHIKAWAESCNLKLNANKCKEMIVSRRNIKTNDLPDPLVGLERVTSLNVLGVTFNCKLSFNEHVNNLLAKGHQRLYAMKILKNHGLPTQILFNTSRSLFISILTYASSAWWGFLQVSELNQLESIVKKAIKWGLLPYNQPTLRNIFELHDKKLFKTILSNKYHALHHLLPPTKILHMTLRPRKHDLVLPQSYTSLQKINFINRMLFADMY